MPGRDPTATKLNITGVCQQLIELARRRVHSGGTSERGLARRAAISQPHLHNVLKGIRILSPDAADRLMEALQVTIPELLWSGRGTDMAQVRAIPFLKHRVGPGTTASFSSYQGYLPFPAAQVAELVEPVVAVLAADLALPHAYAHGDTVLLDQNQKLREAPATTSCWVVADNSGLRVRYVRRARNKLEVGRDPDLSGTGAWQPISLQGRNILEIVRARIVWIGREMETSLPGSAGTSRAGD